MNPSTQLEFPDIPKCLRDPLQRQARMARIREPHMNALTDFVERIRAAGRGNVPYFDPLDGGINARCLFVLEAPGPKAVLTGFVSRNNPDETAKNWFELHVEAGIDRKQTILWNVVPWYLGDGLKIRAANAADVRQGMPYLLELVAMLPHLRVVGLVGRAAGRVRGQLLNAFPALLALELPHPSPMFINRAVGNRSIVLDRLLSVRSMI